MPRAALRTTVIYVSPFTRPTMSPRARRAFAIGAVALMELITIGGAFGAGHEQDDKLSLDPLGITLLALGPLALFFRLRHPVAVLFFVLATTTTYTLIGYPDGPIWLALGTAYFTAHLHGHRRAALASLVIGYVVLGWGPALVNTPGDEELEVGAVVGLIAWLGILYAVGELIRVRRERMAEMERTRAEEAKRQVSDERLRIARELHDVLAHNVSMINVQAGVALHLIDERPEQAREALTHIKAASADTLREMRSVLGVLRAVDEESAPRAPAPSLSRLDGLVERAGAAGLRVRTEVGGDERTLPAGVDLAAFRIVQEALTNVARHAGEDATAVVRIDYGDDALIVQVDDDGRGASASNGDSPGTGAGLRGMQERVSALGGELEARPLAQGGFRVRATLPLDSPEERGC
jgi:signal transduction histidine kinase